MDSEIEESAPKPVAPRVWMVLALLNLAACFASIPYQEALTNQGPYAQRVSGGVALGFSLAVLILITWPAIALGLRMGRGLGLGAPWIEGLLRGEPIGRPARSAFGLAAWTGLGMGVLLLVAGLLLEGAFPSEFAALRGLESPAPWAGLLGAFGAGVGEETWLRLVLLTGLAALGQVIASPQRDPSLPILPGGLPSPAILWTANVIAALVFAALHFLNLPALGVPLTPFLAVYILGFNGAVGLLCGWLYWTRGIEAAIVCHIAVDVVLHGIGALIGDG